ncbi:MAG TPA: hypothetical protein VK111_08875 [Virgibacillus sp.]|nr:hypothetical protein [Virgibacillus sp.]
MTKALNEFKKEAKQKKERVANLEQSIKNNEENLSELESKYKESVIEDSPNIDELFHKMESLQSKITADKHKLKTLKSVTDEHLKVSAVNVLKAFPDDVSLVYMKKVDKVNDRIKQSKKDYVQEVASLQNEVAEINNEHNQIAREYGRIMKSVDITKSDINTTLYLELDDATYGAFKAIPSESIAISDNDIKEVRP